MEVTVANSSFDRVFKVRDEENARKLIRNIITPSKVVVAKRDYERDKKRGIELLTRRFSASMTS